MQWLLIGLAGALAYLYGDANDLATLCLWTKPVPILALLAWLVRSAPPGHYRRWIVLGLLLCLAGDMLLQGSPDFFVFGLGAFCSATWPISAPTCPTPGAWRPGRCCRQCCSVPACSRCWPVAASAACWCRWRSMP